MLSSRCSFGLIAVGVLLTCAPAARSDEWVSCRRDASTGQLLWQRGKSTEFLKNAECRPGATNLDQWDWGRLEPRVYLGDYSLRGKGTRGLARAFVSGPEEDLSIEFNPAIEPGHTVNVVFRGFNPQSSIYQWSTELLADGEDPVRYLGPTLRLNVYEQDPYR